MIKEEMIIHQNKMNILYKNKKIIKLQEKSWGILKYHKIRHCKVNTNKKIF